MSQHTEAELAAMRAIRPALLDLKIPMLAGGMSRTGWAVSFGLIAALMLAALAAFRVMRPRELAGDRSKNA